MTKLKKWLIAVDFTAHDERILQYSEALSQALMPDEILLLHILPENTLPENLFQSDADREAYLRERERSILQGLEDFKSKYFGHRGDIVVNTIILHGSPLPELLRFTQEFKPELLVVGKKVRSNGSGIVAQKLARRTRCAILFVTESARYPAKKVLIPTDYSENASRALRFAIQLRPLLNDPEIHCLYVYDVPLLLPYKIEMLPEQMEELFRKNAEEGMDKYLEDLGAGRLPIVKVLLKNIRNNPARQIIDYAQEKTINLIIMGAKGHSSLESLILGSTTEKMLQYDHEIPILIVR